MSREIIRLSGAVSLWMTAIVLMTVATALWPGPIILAGWSVLVALGGCVLTGWHLLALERARTEHIARIAAERTVEYSRLGVVQ